MIKKFLFLLFPLFVFSQNTTLLKKGDFFFNKSVNDSAVYYYGLGIKNCKNCDQILIADYYLKFGEANRLIRNRVLALNHFLKAEEIYNNLKNYNGITAAKVYLADFYRAIHEYEKSYFLIEEARKIIKKHPVSKRTLAHYYNRRAAIVEQKFNDHDKVIELSLKSIQIAEEIKEYKLMIYSYNEIAYAYENQNKTALSVKYYFKALELAKRLDLGIETCDVLFNIARQEASRIKRSLTSSERKNINVYKKVRNYSKEGLEIATKINYLEKQKDFSRILYESYSRTHELEETMKYNQIFYDYKEQMFEENKKKEIADIYGKYLDEKKDDKIRVNKVEIRTQYFVLVSLAILLTILFLFFRKSKKDKINIQYQKNKTEEALAQKTVLLKEVHHRVKNNLQLISGLLYLQSVKHKNTEVTAMIDESQKHINSIALVHEMLYQDNVIMSLVSMDKYLKKLGNQLLQVSSQEEIEYALNIIDIALPLDYATTLGLILNELVTNSLKYAFTTKQAIISVSLQEIKTNEYLFTYSDNGVGYEIKNNSNTKKTLGQRLIKMLAEEIEADLTIKNEKGLTYTFNFKTKTT